jgi:DNA-binding NarL/FixJ family response regulator
MEKIRILVVDDEEGVLESYKNIFGLLQQSASDSRIEDLQAKLYGTGDGASPACLFSYDITYCQQAREALQAVRQAINENRPFAMAFLDVRMPPGPDGVWAAEQIRSLDGLVNIVMVTAYSDIDLAEIALRVRPLDKLLYIQKPFHTREIQQFGAALGAKWLAERRILNINQELEEKVDRQMVDLRRVNAALEETIVKLQKSEQSLIASQEEVSAKAIDLEGTTIALRQLFKKNEQDQKDMRDKILFSVNEMIKPYIGKMKNCTLAEEAQVCLNVIESNLDEIAAPFMRSLAYKYFRLSPQEIHIANLIKQGNSTKKIAELLNLTSRGVEFHRDKIRAKIGIKHSKAQLHEVLHNLEIEFMS